MADDAHRAKTFANLSCAVLTISDTRTPETDESGTLIREKLSAAGHHVMGYEILPDEPTTVRDRVISYCDGGAGLEGICHVVLLTGGTGLAPRDTTYEAVVGVLDKRLDGFGELFRMLSYEEVGAAAMFSRATAGIRAATAVFSLPGSVRAVRLAMEKLILPEMGHLAALLVS